MNLGRTCQKSGVHPDELTITCINCYGQHSRIKCSEVAHCEIGFQWLIIITPLELFINVIIKLRGEEENIHIILYLPQQSSLETSFSQGNSLEQATANGSTIGSNTENCSFYPFQLTNVDDSYWKPSSKSAGSLETKCSQLAFQVPSGYSVLWL